MPQSVEPFSCRSRKLKSTSHLSLFFLRSLSFFFFFRKNVKTSAVCQYAIKDVQAAFDGPYMELQDFKWREYTGKVPDLRPGSVSVICNISQT